MCYIFKTSPLMLRKIYGYTRNLYKKKLNLTFIQKGNQNKTYIFSFRKFVDKFIEFPIEFF